jgi:hypothetical protein
MLRLVVWQKLTDVSEVLAASIIITLMVKAASTYQTTRRNIPEDSHLQPCLLLCY